MTTTQKRNNAETKSLKLHEIAELVQGELVGDKNLVITGVAGIKEAEKGDIAFLTNAKYLPFLQDTKASAVILPRELEVSSVLPQIRSTNPSQAFTKVVAFFMPAKERSKPGIHPTALVSKSAKIGSGASIGPYCVLEDGCVLGDDVVVGVGCYVGSDARIGQQSTLFPNVTIREGVTIGERVIIHSNTVIGSDGFGYETVDGKHLKIPQVGSVQIGDDVEIGSSVCIDRGRFKNTHVGRGTKIDNLVQIAHNVVIGEDCMIVSLVGISGSATLEDRVVVAGQAGLVGHITVGHDAVIAARSGVSKSVAPGTIVLGEPARPIQEQKRILAMIARLPDFFKDLADLKKKIR